MTLFYQLDAYGGYNDGHLPNTKEYNSLIDSSGYNGTDTSGLRAFIDTDYFDFAFGGSDNGDPTAFGVNFADERIQGYPKEMPDASVKTEYVRYVRDNMDYNNQVVVNPSLMGG